VVKSVLSSPRKRRRLGWSVGIAAVIAIGIPLGIKFANTGESLETPVETGASEPATTAPAERLRVTPAVRRRVGDTVQRFVHTAVIRRDLDDAWALASPLMRQGVTHSQWLRGNLPVQPFPARALANAEWRLRYVDVRTVGIDVIVHPKQGSPQPVMVYAAELTAPGSGSARRFLVDSWAPQATLGGGAAPPPAPAKGNGQAEAVESPFTKGRLGAEWFLVPGAFVLLIAGTLIVLAIRGVLHRRRAERLWRERSGR
jgi:hypothetical protein